jgi:hypothetical protein
VTAITPRAEDKAFLAGASGDLVPPFIANPTGIFWEGPALAHLFGFRGIEAAFRGNTFFVV